LSLDRTEWKLGRLSINLLFIGVAHQGVAYPLVWCFPGKAGSGNLRERLGLLRRLLTFLPKARIQSLCADREFACTGFLRYLRWQKVPYTLRIKAGRRVTYKGHSRPVQRLFRHLGKPCPNRFGCGGNPPIAEGGVPASHRGRFPAGPCSIRPALGDRNPLQTKPRASTSNPPTGGVADCLDEHCPGLGASGGGMALTNQAYSHQNPCA